MEAGRWVLCKSMIRRVITTSHLCCGEWVTEGGGEDQEPAREGKPGKGDLDELRTGPTTEEKYWKEYSCGVILEGHEINSEPIRMGETEEGEGQEHDSLKSLTTRKRKRIVLDKILHMIARTSVALFLTVVRVL
ncbi:unnamed protein product [Dovyalis caffra]|uniref:Uncharacterized protein n=1 Tax=Dovyalis caffra TaxID=77055 RepID=A0AAV1SAK9_9ROSI|nr:unnamed protein product [Dovyalis caffra]